jgi:hypothetical protein
MIPIWARELVFPEGFSQFFESIARGTEAQFGPCKTWREAAGAEQSPKCVGQPPMPSPSCESWGIPRSRLTAVCSPDTRNDGECFCRPRVRRSPGPGEARHGKKRGSSYSSRYSRTSSRRGDTVNACESIRPGGETGRRTGLKIPGPERDVPVRFRSRAPLNSSCSCDFGWFPPLQNLPRVSRKHPNHG